MIKFLLQLELWRKCSIDMSCLLCLLRHKTGLSPPVKYFTDRSKAVLLLWIFYVFVLSCVCYVLCASVYMCFVVTCWERADLLALVCGVFCEFVTFPLVSWVRCGTWLYRFLIFAPLLTFKTFFFTSCQHVYWCVCDVSQLCLVYVNSSITHLQLNKMSVMYKSAHFAIAYQLLEMSSITTPNLTVSNVCTWYIFKEVFRKNICDFTDLQNEKNQSGSFV